MIKLEVCMIIDSSGSMGKQSCATIENTISEGLGKLKEFQDKIEINVGYLFFNEAYHHILAEPIEKVKIPGIRAENGEDGFYRLTLFSKLYQGIIDYTKAIEVVRTENGLRWLFVLFSDGKAADYGTEEYNKWYSVAMNSSPFGESNKLAVDKMINEKDVSINRLFFVNKDAGKIVSPSQFTGKLQQILMDL